MTETNLPPKCIVFDIDGILTDGSKFYSTEDGSPVMAKKFNDLDFTAIKILKCFSIKVYFLSGDSTVNRDLARSRNINFIYSRDERGIALKKASFLEKICNELSIDAKELWYIGDDIFDLSALNYAGKSFCPSNSFEFIKKAVDVVIPRKSGEFLAAWIVDYLSENFDMDLPTEEDVARQEESENQKY